MVTTFDNMGKRYLKAREAAKQGKGNAPAKTAPRKTAPRKTAARGK